MATARTSYAATKQLGQAAAKYSSLGLSGDYIAKVIPVPIPNTEVKLCEPMIVHTSVKVGIARFLKDPPVSIGGFFYARTVSVDLIRSCQRKFGLVNPGILMTLNVFELRVYDRRRGNFFRSARTGCLRSDDYEGLHPIRLGALGCWFACDLSGFVLIFRKHLASVTDRVAEVANALVLFE